MFVKKITNSSVEIDTPAKVNLFLEVLNRREDGFHNINSLFQAVSLFDRLSFERCGGSSLQLTVPTGLDLSNGPENLICRAFEMMKAHFGIKGGLKAKIEKNIPISAGLGGGSSDAAATILACNILFGLNLSYSEMARLGLETGSDIPFFFSSGQAHVTGRGETVRPADFPTNYILVLVKPSLAVSTAQGYASLKRDLTYAKRPFNLARCQTVDDLVKKLLSVGNDFEQGLFRSFGELQEISDALSHQGASLVRLSGSGPTVFGLFQERPEAGLAGRDWWENWQVYTVTPISLPREDKFLKGGNRGDH